MTPRERWDFMFDAIDSEGQDVVLDMLTGEYERVRASRRATLRLINCAQATSNISNQPINPVTLTGVR